MEETKSQTYSSVHRGPANDHSPVTLRTSIDKESSVWLYSHPREKASCHSHLHMVGDEPGPGDSKKATVQLLKFTFSKSKTTASQQMYCLPALSSFEY